jgi:hypothetical protein
MDRGRAWLGQPPATAARTEPQDEWAGHTEPLDVSPARRRVPCRVRATVMPLTGGVASPSMPSATSSDTSIERVDLPVLWVEASGQIVPAGGADADSILRYLADGSSEPTTLGSAAVVQTAGSTGAVVLSELAA